MRNFILGLLALLAAAPALAADNVSLKSEVFVERQVRDAGGAIRTVLQPPKMVTPGDRLVFKLDYRNAGAAPATSFVVTNPIPKAVAYADGASAGEVVSVDGGKSWGALPTLRVAGAGGKVRAATAADVTHVRWTLAKPIPVGGTGTLKFNGVVR